MAKRNRFLEDVGLSAFLLPPPPSACTPWLRTPSLLPCQSTITCPKEHTSHISHQPRHYQHLLALSSAQENQNVEAVPNGVNKTGCCLPLPHPWCMTGITGDQQTWLEMRWGLDRRHRLSLLWDYKFCLLDQQCWCTPAATQKTEDSLQNCTYRA